MEISVLDRTHVFLSFCVLYLIPDNVFLLDRVSFMLKQITHQVIFVFQW